MRADELDPEIAAVVDEIAALGLPEWHELSVDAARRVEDEVFSGDPEPPVAEVRDLAFDGPHGEVPVRVYRPEAALDKSTPSARTLVHFHGGGWTLGTLDSIDGPCRELATRADAVVVSVDYRLAPEHPSPSRSTRRPRPSRGSRATRRRSAATPTDWASPAPVRAGRSRSRRRCTPASSGTNPPRPSPRDRRPVPAVPDRRPRL